ncbi:hypothetical protein [Idiomarina abyssalis]|uniref:hypothetical protein n=1 Tax=Idiomarina abyssalis TaxID=86102 RepID=UPI001CD65863|nr:hypothetical protein [Idiomarina abyssalis]
MNKGRKSEDLISWCQKNTKEEKQREEIVKAILIPKIGEHRTTDELEKLPLAELVSIFTDNKDGEALNQATKEVKHAWYNRNSKKGQYFPVKLNDQQKKSLKSLFNSRAYGASSKSEVITKLIEEARTIQQQDSEFRKSLERYHDRADELARMRYGDKQKKEKDRLQKQLDRRTEKATRLESEIATLKQLNADLEAELLDLLVQNRLQAIVLADKNIDVSQAYHQIDYDKVNVDMSKEFKSRLTAIKSKRSKLNSGYYRATADTEPTDEKGLEEQVEEGHEFTKKVGSDEAASQDPPSDESACDNGGVEPVDEPNPITKELEEKVKRDREANVDSESVENNESVNSSEPASEPNKMQSAVKQMRNFDQWRKK